MQAATVNAPNPKAFANVITYIVDTIRTNMFHGYWPTELAAPRVCLRTLVLRLDAPAFSLCRNCVRTRSAPSGELVSRAKADSPDCWTH